LPGKDGKVFLILDIFSVQELISYRYTYFVVIAFKATYPTLDDRADVRHKYSFFQEQHVIGTP